jgi:hypothetical protein
MELTAELAAKFRSGQRRAQGSAHGGQEHAELR